MPSRLRSRGKINLICIPSLSIYICTYTVFISIERDDKRVMHGDLGPASLSLGDRALKLQTELGSIDSPAARSASA